MAQQVQVEVLLNENNATQKLAELGETLEKIKKTVNSEVNVKIKYDTTDVEKKQKKALSRKQQETKAYKNLEKKLAADLAKIDAERAKKAEDLFARRERFQRKAAGSRTKKEGLFLSISPSGLKITSKRLKVIDGQVQRLNARFEKQKTIVRQNFLSDVFKNSAQSAGLLDRALKSVIAKLTIGGLAVETFKALTGGVTEFLGQGAQFEQLSLALESFGGSAVVAEQLYRSFRDTALKTPFSLPQVADAGKVLLSFGLTSQETSKNLRLLSVAAGATGSDVGLLARNLGQVKLQGKAFTRDLFQFAGAGIPIFTELANVLGVTSGRVKELATEGKIDFKAVQQALENALGPGSAFATISDAQVKTVAGAFGNLQTVTFELAGALNKALGPTFVKILDSLSAALAAVADNFDLIAGVGKVVITLVGFRIVKSFFSVTFYAKLFRLSILGLSKVTSGVFRKSMVVALGQLRRKAVLLKAVAKGGARAEVASARLAVVNKNLALTFKNAAIAARKFALALGAAFVAGQIIEWLLYITSASEEIENVSLGTGDLKDNIDALNKAFDTSTVQTGFSALVNAAVKANATILGVNKNTIAGIVNSFNTGKTSAKEFQQQLDTAFKADGGGFLGGLLEAFVVLPKVGKNIATIKNKIKEQTTEYLTQLNTIKDIAEALDLNKEISQEQVDAIFNTNESLKSQKADVEAQLKSNQASLKALRQQNTENKKGSIFRKFLIASLETEIAGNKAVLAGIKETEAATRRQVEALYEQGRAANIDGQIYGWSELTAAIEAGNKALSQRINLIQDFVKDSEFLQKRPYEALKRQNEDLQRIENARNKEALAAIAKQKRAIQDKYDEEIRNLQEKNIYEKQLDKLELERLRKRAQSGKLSGKALLRANAEYSRAVANQKLEQLNVQKQKEELALAKQERAEKDRSQAVTEALTKTLDSINNILRSIGRYWGVISDDARAAGIEAKRNGTEAKKYSAALDLASKDLKLNYDIQSKARAAAASTVSETKEGLAVQQEVTRANSQAVVQYIRAEEEIGEAAKRLRESQQAAKGLQDQGEDAATSVSSITDQSGDLQTNFNNSETAISGVVSQINAGETALSNWAVYAQQVNESLGNLNFARELGGRVTVGQEYLVNEKGREAFLSDSGVLNLLRNRGYFKPQESGTILPANVVRELDIPMGGLNVAPVDPNRLSTAGLAVYSSRDEAITDAITRIGGSSTQQANELGRLTQSIQAMTNKEWEVKLDIHNKAQNSLLSKMRSQY